MNFKGWMIALLMTSLCTFAMLTVLSDMATTYGVPPLEGSYANTYDQMNDTLGITEEIADGIRSALNPESQTFPADILGGFFKAGWGILKGFINTIELAHAMIVDSAEALGIPYYFTNVFLGIMIIAVAVILMGIVLKYPQINE